MDASFQPLRLPDRLTDGDVVLDMPALADAEAHNAGEDAEMRRRFEAPRPATLEEHRAAFERWIAARAEGGPNIVYAVRVDGALAGGCEIRRLAADRASISYWIYPAFRGRGLAARGLALLCEAAGRVGGVARIEAHIDRDNRASRRTAETAGFTLAGEIEDEEWNGRVVARLLYERANVRA